MMLSTYCRLKIIIIRLFRTFHKVLLFLMTNNLTHIDLSVSLKKKN